MQLKVSTELLESDDMVQFAEKCAAKVRPTARGVYEDDIEEIEENVLPKKVKKKLHSAQQDLVWEVEGFPVAISEVFSPPRIAEVAEEKKLKVGGSYDIFTGYDLRVKKDQEKMWMWAELKADEPKLVIRERERYRDRGRERERDR